MAHVLGQSGQITNSFVQRAWI